MRLVPLRETKTLPFPLRYLSRSVARVRSFSTLLSPFFSRFSLALLLALLIPLGINPSPLSIFCKCTSDFLIAINVRSIAAPFAALACSNVSVPRFSLSSLLSSRSYSHVGFPRFFPIEIDACLFVSLSPRVLSLPISLPYPCLFFRSFSFRRASPPDMCLIFAGTSSISVRLRQHAPHLCASAYQCYVPFFPVILPRLSSPSSLVPAILSSQSVSACHHHILRHISPSLCINFSSLFLSFSRKRSILCHVPFTYF